MPRMANPGRLLRVARDLRSEGPPPTPQLSRAMLATMGLTFVIGLPVDGFAGVPGQLAVSAWTWAVFALLLVRINQRLRLPMLLCLVIATVGEAALSLGWGLYSYWLQNIPLFVPPGHVLLFALGLAMAPRLPQWALILTTAFVAGYTAMALIMQRDTLSVVLGVMFLLFMAFGKNRRLYATMFGLSLLMELYGTWIGNWVWVPEVPGLALLSANPPLCVGALYCALDLCVVNADRLLRGARRPANAFVQPG
ncbi:MAG: hypothetical protein ABI619_04635 [Betaproteobacteria bacterium]